MKSLKERLEEKITKNSEKDYINFCVGFNDPDIKEFKGIYKTGAASLVPLVLELAEALEQYSDDYNTPVATNALLTLEKFLEGK